MTDQQFRSVDGALHKHWPNAKKMAEAVYQAVISDELSALAINFECAGPDAPWTGQEIADHLRERIKNHPAFQ